MSKYASAPCRGLVASDSGCMSLILEIIMWIRLREREAPTIFHILLYIYDILKLIQFIMLMLHQLSTLHFIKLN